MIGYKLLNSDGTSPNGQFKYDLEGSWTEVPGNGSYVAMTEGFYYSNEAKSIKDPIFVKMGCDEPTGSQCPEPVMCFRRVRVIEVLKDIRDLPANLRGEAARYMPGLPLKTRLEILRTTKPSWMRRAAWFLDDDNWKISERKAFKMEADGVKNVE